MTAIEMKIRDACVEAYEATADPGVEKPKSHMELVRMVQDLAFNYMDYEAQNYYLRLDGKSQQAFVEAVI